jgi:hypothetical protein
MIAKQSLRVSAIAAALMLPSLANAATVVDYSVDVLGITNDFSAQNFATGQNFLGQFTLAAPTILKAGAIYAADGFFETGTSLTVRIRADAAGAPDVTNLYEFNTTVVAIDSVGSSSQSSLFRIAGNFGSIALAAGTYWFGMSGTESGAWALNYYDGGTYPGAWQLSGNTLQFSFNNQVGLPFQLYDEAIPGGVPEPASWAMLIAGFGLTGAAMRRRSRAITVNA